MPGDDTAGQRAEGQGDDEAAPRPGDADALIDALDDLEASEAAELDALTVSLTAVLGSELSDQTVDVDRIWADIDRRIGGDT